MKKSLRKHLNGQYRPNFIKNLRTLYLRTYKRIELQFIKRKMDIHWNDYDMDYRYLSTIEEYVNKFSIKDVIKFYFIDRGYTVKEYTVSSIYKSNPDCEIEIEEIIEEIRKTDGSAFIDYVYEDYITSHKFLYSDPYRDGLNEPYSNSIMAAGLIYRQINRLILDFIKLADDD